MSPPISRDPSRAGRANSDERLFIARLGALAHEERKDRAALAALRQGLGRSPWEVGSSHEVVVPRLPRSDLREADEEAYYHVAALFAFYPTTDWIGAGADAADAGDSATTRPAAREIRNLGVSFRQLARKTGSESIGARFVALLSASREEQELQDHLRHAVGLLRAHEIPIDWAQLLHDVLGWERDRTPVQRAWARAFWRSDDPDAEVGKTTGSDDGAAEADAGNQTEA